MSAYSNTRTPAPQQRQGTQQRQQRKEYTAPNSAANVTGVFFVRTQPIVKTYGDFVVADVILGFGQPPDKEGNKSGGIKAKAFHELATFIEGNIVKESKVYVTGRLNEARWKDKETGDERSQMEIHLTSVIPCTTPRVSESDDEYDGG